MTKLNIHPPLFLTKCDALGPKPVTLMASRSDCVSDELSILLVCYDCGWQGGGGGGKGKGRTEGGGGGWEGGAEDGGGGGGGLIYCDDCR